MKNNALKFAKSRLCAIFVVLNHICGANAADLSSAFFVPVGDNLLQPRKCWVVETPHRFADMNGAALNLAFLFAKSYLMNPLQVFSYNGSEVSMTRNENGVVYVNLTEFAKPFPSKNLTQIINSQEIKEYCEALSKLQNYSLADLLLVKRGGNDNGTWAHQKVALRVAQKLSPDFAVWVDTKIEEILTQAVATTDILSPAELLLHQSQLLVENERKMQELESKQKALESELAEVKQRTTANLDQSTIVAYVSRNAIKLDVTRYGAMGKKASALCKKRGIEVTKINDVRWGLVSVYPDTILDEVFSK